MLEGIDEYCRDNRTVATVCKKCSVSVDVSLISWVNDNCSMGTYDERRRQIYIVLLTMFVGPLNKQGQIQVRPQLDAHCTMDLAMQ